MSVKKMHGGAAHTAEEFVLAGMELSKKAENNRLIAPTMVCFSFAVELFLKGILSEEQVDPGKNHDLWSLYQLLPDRKKSWVQRMYALIVDDVASGEFEKEIERWGKTFVEIRYWHDETGKEQAFFDFSNFIPNLAIGLNNAYLHTEKFSRFYFPQIEGAGGSD
ncbi:hypothetical protein [Marinimicrobium sp. ABcell2]|uniref:hypothetical protein n=1 Tax=Marinimicrobium sp. ABcell2 TaxID=3069751 RepID=UPI0027B159A4|nr:hypothetical protein [Marinimicrobium sp. ABcell2]MDQ2076752.1 hypothetical protein [Marinimicrobium sp. ABcell2]